MKNRCDDIDNKKYGGRGIKYCDEWRNYELFKEWAIGAGYNNTLSIERINVNGNYEPGNCCWIPISEQNYNKRTNNFITYNDETHPLCVWANRYNIKPATLSYRLNCMGLCFEDAVNLQINIRTEEQYKKRKNTHMIEWNGCTYPLSKWSKITGIPRATITERIKRGWDIDKALRTPVNSKYHHKKG